YRLKIISNGNEFEAEGDKAFVLDMAKRFSAPSSIALPESRTPEREVYNKKEKSSSSKSSIGKGLSIREFIQQLEVKKHTDITLAFGYYLEKHGSLSHFSPADINKCYYDAKMESSNTSQMVIQNIKSGRMMEAKAGKVKGGKQYILTNSGEKFVETKFKKNS
ncbi:MAG: hypothetical protein WBK77_05045, partial [Alphaproteobacteria bacterium]